MSQFGGQKAVDEQTARMAEASIGYDYKEDCEKYMAAQNIQKGDDMIKNPPANANYTGRELTISSNIFRARPQPPVEIFQYSMKIEGKNTHVEGMEWQPFTTVGSNDFFNIERAIACAYIYTLLQTKVSEIKEKPQSFFYDRRAILYSTTKLDRMITETFSIKELIETAGVDREDANQMASFRNFTDFRVIINENMSGKSFSTDLSVLGDDHNVSNMNPEFVHFLDVVSSQAIMENRDEHISFPNGASYFMNPDAYGYKSHALTLENGIYLAPGLSKSARLVKNAEGGGAASAIVVKPKISPFHSIQTVAEKVENITSTAEMKSVLRGVYVFPAHLFRRTGGIGKKSMLKTFKIVDLGPKPDDITFESHAGKLNVRQYFEQQHNYKIQYPDLPTIKVKHAGTDREEFYPMEVCEVLDNQRLGTAAMTSNVTSKIIKLAAAAPIVLSARVRDAARALEFDSKYMNEAKIAVEPNPIELNVPVLAAPAIAYRNMPAEYDLETNKWMSNRCSYMQCAPIHTQWALYAVCRRGQSPTERDLHTFADKLVLTAGRFKGVPIKKTTEIEVLQEAQKDTNAPPLELREKMRAAKEGGCLLVMVITQKEDTGIHAALKAYEQEFGIVTQNVTLKNARAGAGIGEAPKNLTMENIVNKMNMKLGGVNYTLKPPQLKLSSSDLIVGLCINHAAGGRGAVDSGAPPSIIGYTSNDGGDPIAFTGDFVYQPASRGMQLSALQKVIEDVAGRYMERNKQKAPQRVIIYRNGLSEGDYGQVLRYEIPVIRKYLAATFDADVPITFIICSRTHNARFYPKNLNAEAKPIGQNVPAGTVIHREVVHPNIPEFYLATCRSQMGTAKVPRYAVLYNSANMHMKDIHEYTMTLGFAHQIINQPIGTPAVVYIAEEYAKRGRNLYNARVNEDRLHAARSKEDSITKVLGYKSTDIRDQRVNA